MYDELIIQIRQLQHWFKPNDSECFNPYEILEQAADAIEELSKANQMIVDATLKFCAAHMWIPVTERFPNCNGCYLVWRPHFFGGEIGMPSICYFDGSNTWHDSYGVDFARILHPEDVTHWMPLPEPPESEGE